MHEFEPLARSASRKPPSLIPRTDRLYQSVANIRPDQFETEILLVDQSAMEADHEYSAQNLGINVKDTAMRIGFTSDKMIEAAKLKPVTSAIMFEKGNVPTADGLFSYDIFGATPNARKKTFGYIDLKRKFFQPYIYEVLRKVLQITDKIVKGQTTWAVVNGVITETFPGDEKYVEDATGLRWLIDHYREIDFTKNSSYIHNEYVSLLINSTDDEIFISKWLVCPVFYRDANFNGHSRDIPELNDKYKKLIQFVGALRSSELSMFMNNTELNIQLKLKDIRTYGQELIEGKSGFLKQYVIGKTTAYGARNVISQPIYSNAKTPDDIMIDIFHSGFPIATCCSMAFPFIEHWILDFIGKEFETREKKQTLVKDASGNLTLQFAKIGDVLSYYNPSYIEKKVEQYLHTYGNRFEPLTIPMADGTTAYMLFTGRPYSKDPRNPNAPMTARRAMTWTDLLYLACVETLEYGGKMAYITRYPLVDYFGTFPSMIRVTSTAVMEPMEFNGQKYPFYPQVVLGASQDEVSTLFVETVTMDNVYLKGLGGDYDGDMTSERACFTEEANDEAFQILNDKKHFISISGNLMRMISNEAYLTYYNMTRR